MLRLRCTLRNVIHYQLRYYRRRLRTNIHIPALQENKSLQNEELRNANSFQPNNFQLSAGVRLPYDPKKMEFEELDTTNNVEELILRFLKHTNSGHRQSFKNFSGLEKKLKSHKEQNERLQILFDYLLKESGIEIRMLNQLGPINLRKKSEKTKEKPSIKTPEQLEDAIFADVFSFSDNKGGSFLSHTDFIYQILSDLNSKESPGAGVLKLEQIVQTFELAKLINIEERRRRGIFLAGRLLYSLGTVRLDPVNESFYIDSLVNYGLYRKAFELFESNRTKVNERWWYELGMMIALRANYLNKFEKLLVTTDLRFGKYPYISLQVLKLAVRRKLLLGDFKSANKLTDRFLEIVSTWGCTRFNQTSNKDSRKMITFNTQEQADKFLNELMPPNDHDFVTLIEYHLFKKNVGTAMKLVAKYLETEGTDDQNYRFLIVKSKLYLLQNFEQLRSSLGPHLKQETVQQKLSQLQNSFEEVRKEHNLDTTFTQELFFKNIASLTSFPELAKVMEEFLAKNAGAVCTKSSTSKNFHALLKIFLAMGKEKQAFFLLTKMEEAFLKCRASPELKGKQFYAEVQPHHYAVFVEYFTLSKNLLPKSMQSDLENKVDSIVERMENHGVPYNSVLLTKLLIFYRDFNNFNKCFEIINQVIGEKVQHSIEDSNRSGFYSRRDITRPLYLEMWRTYSKYYKIFHKELERTDKKSNYSGWKMQVIKIIKRTHLQPKFPVRTLFNAMVNLDNALPDTKMYHLILTTIMRSRDWAIIPGVLYIMTELHGISLDNEFSSYLLKGLEKELFVIMSRKYQADGQITMESKIQALSTIKDLKYRGLILVPQSSQPYGVDDLITQILMLLKLKNPQDTQFNDVQDAMKELHVVKENLWELINHVNFN